jgi:histone-lysine N-methyltransferase SETD3
VNPSFTWSDAELALLDGSPAIKATRSMQAKLRAEYASLLGGVFKDHPRVFTGTNRPGDPSLGEEAAGAFCFAHFEWAFTMLFSRAIRLDKLTGGPAVCRKSPNRSIPPSLCRFVKSPCFNF